MKKEAHDTAACERAARRLAERILASTQSKGSAKHGGEALITLSSAAKALAGWLSREAQTELVIASLLGGQNRVSDDELQAAAEELARLMIQGEDLRRERDEAREGWATAVNRANDNFSALQDEQKRAARLNEKLSLALGAAKEAQQVSLRALDVGEKASWYGDMVLSVLKDMYVIAEADGWGSATSGRQVIFRQATDLINSIRANSEKFVDEPTDADEADSQRFCL